MTPLLALLRPAQWTKNALVLAAFLFALGDQNQSLGLPELWRALAAMACFCLASSGIYILNDLRDAPLDRLHPTKCKRPIASGAIKPAQAQLICVLILGLSLACSWLLEANFALVVGIYIAVQLAYTLLLKSIPFVDVGVLAFGFVLRAFSGGAAIKVHVSGWLLLCTFLLALFVALCKRRHEKVEAARLPDSHRPALDRYSLNTLNRMIISTAALTVIAYAIYTVWPDTVDKFGDFSLALTTPFVAAGVARYLQLVYKLENGGRPERVVLTDLPIIICLAGYGATVLFIFFA